MVTLIEKKKKDMKNLQPWKAVIDLANAFCSIAITHL